MVLASDVGFTALDLKRYRGTLVAVCMLVPAVHLSSGIQASVAKGGGKQGEGGRARPGMHGTCSRAPSLTVTMKMACDRDEVAFILVDPTERFLLPTFITCSISFPLLTTKDERSLTYTPVSGFSFSCSFCFWFFDNKSLSRQEPAWQRCPSTVKRQELLNPEQKFRAPQQRSELT